MRPYIVLCILIIDFRLCTSFTQQFPKDFIFGVASSSYQIEGAWNEDGKAKSIWDTQTHVDPNSIKDHSNGDIACDSYHKIKEDIQILVQLGVQFYRFSLSWSRLLPEGHAGKVNPYGVQYYNELIDQLLLHNITPFITLYHWDLPQQLEEIGGWLNPLIIDYFEDYSMFAFRQFGDRVKYWLTFNEPIAVCWGYGGTKWPPGRNASGIGDYLCGHNVLKAHGKVYRLYQKFKADQKDGKLGIVLGCSWYEPMTNSTKDLEARERLLNMEFGWFMHPIFSKEGDYPKVMRERINQFSNEELFPRSRLPTFTPSEIIMIQGSTDFLGLNHYTSYLVRDADEGEITKIPSNERDVGVIKGFDPEWIHSSVRPNEYIVPRGFYKVLMWIKEKYNPIIYITENGFSDNSEHDDHMRVFYMKGYINEMSNAINDGANVKGYTAWSLIDNFEWFYGYSLRYGLYYVNFTDPDRPRTAKKSAIFYKTIVSRRKIDEL